MKKGFTLVELLAVIVILAVILVIAVPQINNVIKETRKNSLGSTAKLIAAKAEEKEVENDALEKTESITCADLVKLDDNYGNCTVTKNSTTGKWEVTIVGAGKFAGYSCTGTKSDMNCTEGSSSSSPNWVYAFGEIESASEGEQDYTELDKPVFLRYNANDLSEKYVCTLYGGSDHCFKYNDWDTNKTSIPTLFNDVDGTNEICSLSLSYVDCTMSDPDYWYCSADSDGGVGCSYSSYGPRVDCWMNSNEDTCNEGEG